MLQARGLSVEVGGRFVVVEASLTTRAGEKVGLVGRNGVGKTSLLKVLGGEAPAAAGTVLRRGQIGYLPQDPRPHYSAGTTALGHVLSGRRLDEVVVRMEKLRARVEERPTEANVARFARAHDTFERAGGYAAESEARRIVAGLGLTADRLDLHLGALSGGELRRVELARILFGGSDLLLLDEPTNHLDTDAKAWLMGFLRSFRGGLVVVSHDLDLLDEAITRVLHLEDGDIIEYRGTYSEYLEARRRDEERLTRLAGRQEAEIVRLSRLADGMRGQTEKRARKAKVLDHRVERLQSERVNAPKRRRSMALRLPDPPHAGRVVLRSDGLTKGYGGPPIFGDVSFDVGRGERLLVMGLNGAGKTSLLRIVAGVMQPDAGHVTVGSGVTLGYYAQEHEGIEAGRDVLSHMRAQIEAPDLAHRRVIGMFGLSGDIAFQDAGTLSGGEKTKLALAQLCAGRHNLLLLDEPTNNLDPPSRDGVGRALASWPGSMILVSHDPQFVRALRPDRVLLMPEGALDYWSDDLLDLVALA